jgi:O-methyltransferase involved in polyketide biosynthesis
MTTEKVRFTKELEAMLLTLYSRALHSRGADPLLGDP